MTIWLHTPDQSAAQRLSALLRDAGADVVWEPDAAELRARVGEAPRVVVLDVACAEHDALARELEVAATWARVVVLGPGTDLAELTLRLLLEAERAELAKSWHDLASERRRLERGLENAERLATIGRIATGMAHEVNNPLAVIRASAAYVAEIASRTDDSELGLCASDIEAAVERIGDFVQHVTSFARSERPQIANTSLNTALEIALRMIRPHAKEQAVKLTIGVCPRVPVPHDPPRLAQAFLSLLANAVEAAQLGGGHVSVRVEFDDAELRVEIEDDGPGLAPELRERAFEPFATTKSATHAAGLGLTITRQIAADHGGRVELRPVESGGLCAALVLPRFSASVYRLLVVHDDAVTRRGLASELRREGFDVITAASFATARERLRERRVHLVIANAGSPELGELRVSRALPNTSARVIALCAGADPRRAEGADHTFTAPCEGAELVRVARELCLKGERRPSREPAAP